MRTFEFLVSGIVTVAAHCEEDANEAVKDAVDGVMTSYNAVHLA
jgi:hypothetical protein